MKLLRAISLLSGSAILLLAASTRQASAGEMYGWGSYPGCAGCGGYGYSGGYGYGAWGSGGYSMGAGVTNTFWMATEYDRYIVGHGPMFPGENYPGPKYSYKQPPEPETPAATKPQ
jgi:hypothetical protein